LGSDDFEIDGGLLAAAPPLERIRARFPGDRAPIRAGSVEFGGDRFIVVAGPCAVESERQVMDTAEAVARAGAHVLRGGGFKPRTSPYTFQGLGIEGLKLLRKAGDAFGMPVISEAMTDTQVGAVAEYADIIQVGARSMENAALLAAVGRCGRPALLKRGLTATIEELLAAAEYLASAGNPDIILCERGIRTFGALTRNTCDIAAVAVLNCLTRLPVIVDPSHATGRRCLVPPLARAAVAIGAAGLMVEVHPRPPSALSDGGQSLGFAQFERMMLDLQPYLALWTQSQLSAQALNLPG
jgi:3-deoxy-7-phosphoheptulonate synthase